MGAPCLLSRLPIRERRIFQFAQTAYFTTAFTASAQMTAATILQASTTMKGATAVRKAVMRST